MQNITGPDEVCLILHLLYNTTIQVGLGKLRSEPFQSNIGTPQGDGISPILFVCYLEAAMQECRSTCSSWMPSMETRVKGYNKNVLLKYNRKVLIYHAIAVLQRNAH